MSTYQEVDISAVFFPASSTDQLWDGTQFVINGQSILLTSPDGLTWSSPGSVSGFYLAFDGTTYVCVGPLTNAYTSTDLVTWTSHALPGSVSSASWKSICWAAGLGLFVAVAQNIADTHKIMTSPDGATWTVRVVPSATPNCKTVIWSAALGLLVAVMDLAGDGVLTSPDGTTWTHRTTDTDCEPVDVQGASQIAWSPSLGLFAMPVRDVVLVEYFILTSPDGITWAKRSVPHSTDRTYHGIVWAPAQSKFLALAEDTGGGVNALIVESPDGTTWTAVDTTVPGYWMGLVWADSIATLVAGPWGAASVLTGVPSGGAETVTRVVPAIGKTAGGKLVSIYGTNFSGTPVVTFDGSAATAIAVVSATKLKCRTPAHATGLVDVVVGAGTLANGFRYRDAVFGNLTIRMAQQILVDDVIHDAPNTAKFTAGKTGDPTLGETLNITDPASGAVLFGGSALVLTTGIDGKPGQEHRDVDCGDFAWRLDAVRPHGTYVEVSATDVVQDLFDTFAPLFTPDVEASLPAVTVTFDRSKTFSQCLSAIVGFFGGAWTVDDDFGVKVFTEDTDDPPDDITDATPLYDPPPTVVQDLTQVRNRVYVKGAGSGDSYVPAATAGTATPFSSLSGGQVVQTAGGSIPAGFNYDYGMSFVTDNGETVPVRVGPFGSGIFNSFQLSSLDQYCSTDSRVTGRKLYRTKSVDLVGGVEQSRLWVVATFNNTPGSGDDSYLDTKADADLTALAPAVDTTGTVFVMREDTAAQTYLAGLFADGDDGIREGYISDPNLTTLAMAEARGDAELALFAYPITTVTYACRDVKSKSGKQVTIALTSPAVSGTFRIQKVSIDQVAIDGEALQLFPRFKVIASSVLFTLDDLLRGLVGARTL